MTVIAAIAESAASFSVSHPTRISSICTALFFVIYVNYKPNWYGTQLITRIPDACLANRRALTLLIPSNQAKATAS